MSHHPSELDHIDNAKRMVLDAALPHVLFDGWNDTLLENAITRSGVDAGLAQQAFPRGVIDLLVYFHCDGDKKMIEAYQRHARGDLKIRESVTLALRLRLEALRDQRDAVRRASSFFAVPSRQAEGAELIWQTCDKIWRLLGDQSDDLNWYTKRASLAVVYTSTVLYWLGDNTAESVDTWAFLDRRIADVMKIEQAKAKLKNSPLGDIVSWISSAVRPPQYDPSELPGYNSRR